MENITIENLEEKLRHAMLTSDVAVLDELIADDLVWTMHTGKVVNKQFDLEAHRSGMFRFTSFIAKTTAGICWGHSLSITPHEQVGGSAG